MENHGRYFENNFKDNYHSKLLDLSDAKLRTEDGRIFQIHKYMLAKSSKYFCALFCSVRSGNQDILIQGINGDTMSNILSYIYTNNIHVTEDNICDLIVASDYFLLDDLLSTLKAALKRNLTADNSLQIFVSAMLIHQEEMYLESFRFIQINFESILFSRDCKICDLPLETFQMLIRDRNLRVRSERIIWLAIAKWVNGDPPSRQPYVPDLLMYLTVADVDETIANEILEHEMVSENPFCKKIHDIKTFLTTNNLTVLQYYIQSLPKPLLTFYNHRKPEKFHYVVFYRTRNNIDGIDVYLTYDENIDLWRKLFTADLSPEFILSVNETLYLFGFEDRSNWNYNVIEKRWNELRDFRIPRYNYVVVQLNGQIYVLGGLSEDFGEEICDVEYFNSETNIWFFTSPMLHASSFSAVTLNNSIFVIGSRSGFDGYEMVTQIYNHSTRIWNRLSSPSTIRHHFTMVVYHEKIYVIGGSNANGNGIIKDVEVFDPTAEEWNTEADLPYEYYVPEAIVFNDNLIVYDNHFDDREYRQTNPPVYWNIYKKSWEIFQNTSFMNNLHRHCIITVENGEFMNTISKENRDPSTRFEKSHFS